MMRCSTYAIPYAILAFATSNIVGAETSHVNIYVTGWASRLHSLVDVSPPLLGSKMILEDEAGSTLQVAKYVMKLVSKWLKEEAVEVTEEVGEPTKVWKDSAPRFIVYEDKYSHNFSLGLPDPSMLQGVTHYLVPFWTVEDGVTDSILQWTQGNARQRKAIVDEYNKRGIRLGLSVIFSHTSNPIELAQGLATFVVKYNFQGLDIDYRILKQIQDGILSNHLVSLARQLRIELSSAQGYFLSHSSVVPFLNSDDYSWIEKQIGPSIDFYTVQFDQAGLVSTCKTLFHRSYGKEDQTAFTELKTIWSIPMNKLVVGWPASLADESVTCLAEAASLGRTGGAVWRNIDQDSIQSELQPILTKMYHSHNKQRHLPQDHRRIHSPKRRIARRAVIETL